MPDSGCLEPLAYETRNLGVESFRVSPAFLAAPDETTLAAALHPLHTARRPFFVQARFTPDSRTSRMLEGHGFYFVESTLSPGAVLTRYRTLDQFVEHPAGVLPRRYDAADFHVTLIHASDEGMMAAVRTIAGESFADDRFHVDHNCPPGVADRRYRFWIDDLLHEPGVRIHVLLRAQQVIAFMASRGGDLLLAGFAPSHASAGLGEFFWLSVLERLRADGVARVMTRISAANVAVVNLYARLNFKFRDPASTFHLWSIG